MHPDPDVHHCHSIRLRDYDYAQAGAYFVTVCTHDHACLLGDIIDGAMRLSAYGESVDHEWQRNYWEHVIRDEDDLTRLRDYIVNNPGKWVEDMYYSAASG